MQVSPYLSFNGDCEEAFTFYEKAIGGVRGMTNNFGGSPMAGQVPPEWHSKVMHTTLAIGNTILMGSDAPPGMQESPKGFSVSLVIDDAGDADRVFAALSAGGTVRMPIAKTFWAERFGMLVDRFGIPWLVNCEGAEAPA